MPFGKHKGWPLEALPTNYLDWLLGLGTLREPLASAVRQERARRESGATSHSPLRQLDPAIAQEVIRAGYRQLALKHHPDHGGETATMQRLNGTVEALRQPLTAPGTQR
jgi:hypothetical protein